ncbi:MAG: HAD-IC family P-type ATPase, partial [Pseudonocardia sp.]|nr:HAD-IC family P-type ATPase [Pseudonocardia sp.]
MAEASAWHAVPASDVADAFDVDVYIGLSEAEVRSRRRRDGPNRLAPTPREPRWRAFLRQFTDLMIVILLVAAAVSLVVTREWETPVVIAAVVLLNAVIGFVQESRAEASLVALQKMLVTTASVRRDGAMLSVDADELVVGDVVALDAGARVPADGRVVSAVALEVAESVLTGEAQPVVKSATARVDEAAALGDRSTAVHMTTMVTRGHGEFVVTATGMRTETGRIAHLLHSAEPGPTPLQAQITSLSRTLAIIAATVVPVVFGLGLLRGQEFGALFVSAVSLAVAAIPEGLPAVVTFTLAMGASRLAKRGAVVKRLASVETLGSTSQICTDKTGTLTLNQMTARELVVAGQRLTVSGAGYGTEGEVRSADGSPVADAVAETALAVALCSDAELRDGEVVGDPTEGALLVLAAKTGVDVAAVRREYPRLREVPFDSEYKFMATFHGGPGGVRGFVKGAPDVLLGRADRYRSDTGT